MPAGKQAVGAADPRTFCDSAQARVQAGSRVQRQRHLLAVQLVERLEIRHSRLVPSSERVRQEGGGSHVHAGARRAASRCRCGLAGRLRLRWAQGALPCRAAGGANGLGEPVVALGCIRRRGGPADGTGWRKRLSCAGQKPAMQCRRVASCQEDATTAAEALLLLPHFCCPAFHVEDTDTLNEYKVKGAPTAAPPALHGMPALQPRAGAAPGSLPATRARHACRESSGPWWGCARACGRCSACIQCCIQCSAAARRTVLARAGAGASRSTLPAAPQRSRRRLRVADASSH